MDKLTLAHTYAMLHMSNPQYKDVDDLEMVGWSFDYAEAMLAEEEKRKDKSRPIVIEKLDNVDWVDELEFQVDWSQAPSWAVWWCVCVTKEQVNGGFWMESKPTICEGSGGRYSEYNYNGRSMKAPSFNYQGDWKESLRERP